MSETTAEYRVKDKSDIQKHIDQSKSVLHKLLIILGG